MANSKLSAFFSLLLVFVSGVVVGGVGYRVYYTATPSGARPPDRKSGPTPEELKKMLVAEMTNEVHLNGQQVARLSQIYDETREKFMDLNKKRNADGHAIWDEQIKEIEAMLTPEQRPLYDQLRARKEKDREEFDRKRRGHKGPGEIRKD